MTEPTDWRGVPIVPGCTVIYGSPDGNAIQTVEGIVSEFTSSGRVWVEVTRRSGWVRATARPRIHVAPAKVTVVDGLPPSPLSTQGERVQDAKARTRAWYEGLLAAADAGTPKHAWATAEYCRQQLGKL